MTEPAESWLERNHFTVRRVHSLLGIIPIGAFLVEHMLTNSLAWFGPEKFNEQVHWLHQLHYLIWLEVLFIFLPIALHAIYGVVIVLTARNNATKYPYLDNWRFLLQRYTGVIAVIFILVHLGHFRFAHFFGGTHYVGIEDPFVLTQQGFAIASLGAVWYPLYVIGLIAAVYHFANGLCTFCITWGITIGDESRLRASFAAAGVGAVMLIWGFMSLWAFGYHAADQPAATVGDTAHAAVQQQIEPETKDH